MLEGRAIDIKISQKGCAPIEKKECLLTNGYRGKCLVFWDRGNERRECKHYKGYPYEWKDIKKNSGNTVSVICDCPKELRRDELEEEIEAMNEEFAEILKDAPDGSLLKLSCKKAAVSNKEENKEKIRDWNSSKEPYRDSRWLRLKKKCLERDDYTCDMCETKKDARLLTAHHETYENCPNGTVLPWESPLDDLITRCHDCHGKDQHERKTARRDRMIKNVEGLRKLCRDMYWALQSFDPDDVQDMLALRNYRYAVDMWITTHSNELDVQWAILKKLLNPGPGVEWYFKNRPRPKQTKSKGA